jgi:acyl carrier protein
MQTETEIKPSELNENQKAARLIISKLCNGNFTPEDIQGEMLINEQLGLGSLKLIRLILEIETSARKRIFNVENIATLKTVNNLYALLSSE